MSKVLHFKTTYLNRSETFIDRLVRNHQEFEPVIATCYKRAYTNGLNVYEMPKKGGAGLTNNIRLKLNSSPGFLYDVFEKEQPDLVHGHFGLDSYRLIPLIKKFNVPFIVNFYGHDVIRLPQEFGWTTRYTRLRKHMDCAIAGSEDMKRNLIKLGFDKSTIHTIKLAVNIDDIRFQLREKASPKIMMVGRLVEKKGFTNALNAVSMLHKQMPDIEMNIFGDGELLEDLKSEAKSLGIENHVHFKGFTDNPEIINQLYQHDMLIVPSVQARDGDREGIPQTTVEGMATGIPAIASDHAGLPELIKDGETGLQVPERDANAIKEAIIKLVKNPEFVKKISLNGRKIVEKEHNLKTQVKKMEDLYKLLLRSI
ncbi:MAG: glycosyltransferase [Balneolaceae bacterium]